MLLAMPQTPAWVSWLDFMLEQLGPGPWAVRSSAVAEDGEEASFAGQQHTRLWCTTRGEVFEGIREILERLYHVELQLYQAQVGVGAVAVGSGVVIQPMEQGERSGVLFTHDPLGTRDDAFVVTAAEGGAAAVVEGRRGETFHASRLTGHVLRGGGDRGVCQALFPLVQQIREAYGEQPWDLEWTQRPCGQVVVLQMRPAKPVSPGEEPVVLWTNANVGEALPAVGSPMTWSIIERFSRRGFVRAFGAMGLKVPRGARLVGGWQGRVYLNLSEFMAIASKLPWMSPQLLWRVAGGGELTPWVLEHLGDGEPGRPGEVAKTLLGVVRRLPRLAMDWGGGPWQVGRWERHVLGRRQRLEAMELRSLGDAELASWIAEHDRLFEENGERMLAVAARFLLGVVALRGWMSWRFGGEEGERLSLSLMSGMALRSSEPVEALRELATMAAGSARLQEALGRWKTTPPPRREMWQVDRAFAKRFEAMLHRDGFRAQGEAELAVPRWREAPHILFDTIHRWAREPLPPRVDAVETRSKAAATLRQRLGPLESILVLKAWEGRRSDAAHRETLRALVVETLAMYRRFFLEAGERLCHAQVLLSREEVFLLTHDEVMGWLAATPKPQPWTLKLLVLLRQEKLTAQRALPPLPSIFLSKGPGILPEPAPEHAEPHPSSHVLVGLPGAPGQVVGRVHVASDGIEMAWGAVLVMPHADIGATPLFMRASALVMELGGPLSHACIVAREYGIPTVVNLTGAMRLLAPGAMVRVDGAAGTVELLETED